MYVTKRLVGMLIAMLITSGLLGYISASTDQPVGTKAVEFFGIAFEVPTNWEVLHEDGEPATSVFPNDFDGELLVEFFEGAGHAYPDFESIVAQVGSEFGDAARLDYAKVGRIDDAIFYRMPVVGDGRVGFLEIMSTGYDTYILGIVCPEEAIGEFGEQMLSVLKSIGHSGSRKLAAPAFDGEEQPPAAPASAPEERIQA